MSDWAVPSKLDQDSGELQYETVSNTERTGWGANALTWIRGQSGLRVDWEGRVIFSADTVSHGQH